MWLGLGGKGTRARRDGRKEEEEENFPFLHVFPLRGEREICKSAHHGFSSRLHFRPLQSCRTANIKTTRALLSCTIQLHVIGKHDEEDEGSNSNARSRHGSRMKQKQRKQLTRHPRPSSPRGGCCRGRCGHRRGCRDFWHASRCPSGPCWRTRPGSRP